MSSVEIVADADEVWPEDEGGNAYLVRERGTPAGGLYEDDDAMGWNITDHDAYGDRCSMVYEVGGVGNCAEWEEGETSCYSFGPVTRPVAVEDKRGEFVQGYVRMGWFLGIKCWRFLRLMKGGLQCFDRARRRKLWEVQVEGARVRVCVSEGRIVLSKLRVGSPVEFWVGGGVCREWGGALLRAASPPAVGGGRRSWTWKGLGG